MSEINGLFLRTASRLYKRIQAAKDLLELSTLLTSAQVPGFSMREADFVSHGEKQSLCIDMLVFGTFRDHCDDYDRSNLIA